MNKKIFFYFLLIFKNLTIFQTENEMQLSTHLQLLLGSLHTAPYKQVQVHILCAS
jgi:hypothetical protein